MSGTRPLRAYTVTHYARVKITNTVAARTLREAVEQDEAGNHIDEGWASEAWPVTRGVARRYPPLDELAALADKGSQEAGEA